MKIYISIILIFLSPVIYSQTNDITFSGNYNQVPFIEFVGDVEQKTNATFYYLQDWIKDIKITAKGNSLSLNKILFENFVGTNLYFHITENKIIYITKEKQLVVDLPEYRYENDKQTANNENKNGNNLTYAEKLYIQGRQKSKIETITIGSKQRNGNEHPILVTGKIQDEETGEPLIGATIFLEDISYGTVTDVNGRFSLSVPAGTYKTVFNCLGMEENTYYLNILSTGNIEIEMKSKLIAINEVTVKADRYDKVRGMQMGFEHITLKTIKEVPVVMGEQDVLKVARMLPGVQDVGEGSSGFNVRGSAADQNMFYINKVPVYNTSHLFGFFSSFSPELVKDFSFYKGNIPAKYGGRLASVFELSSKQGNKKKYTAHGGISPITGHLSVEGPIQKDKSSFLLTARSTYSDWILKRLNDAELRNSKANFNDFGSFITFEPNNNNLVKIFGYYSQDNFSLASTHIYNYSNAGGSVNWWHQYGTDLSSDISLITSNYNFSSVDSTTAFNAYKHRYQIDHYEVRADFNWQPTIKHKVVFGANTIKYDLNRGQVLPSGPESARLPLHLGSENAFEGGIHLSDEFELIPNLTLYAGIRYSVYGFMGPGKVYEYAGNSPKEPDYITDTLHFNKNELVKFYSNPEIRAALNYRTGKNSSVKLSYNQTTQFLVMLSNTIAISPTDQWKLCDYHLAPPKSDHISAGFYNDIYNKNINLSTEIYYKSMNNIVEFKDGANFLETVNIEENVLQGKQKAYGIELMAKKNSGKFTGWVTYSYSRSIVTVNGDNLWDKINNGKSYAANYDRPIGINAVMNLRLNRQFSIASNVVYNTGRPVTYPVSVFSINGQEHINYSDRNKYRIPDYFRIDLSFNIEGNLKAEKLAHSYWMLNIYNLTGRKNAYSVYFQSENGLAKAYKMSIFGIPVITLSWNFKLGNYASE